MDNENYFGATCSLKRSEKRSEKRGNSVDVVE